MAREVRTFTVLVPAGTAIATPQTTALAMPSRIVRSVRFRIPPGPSGSVGFRLASGGVQVIPWEPGTWLVMDGEAVEWPLEGQIETGAWQLQAYNVGRWDHTLYVTMLLDPVTARDSFASASAPLDLGP
jgi:hypothetical protein